MFRTLGFILSTLGSVPFTFDLGTLNTFHGTDPKVDRVKLKVRNMIFSPVYILAIPFNGRYANNIIRTINILLNTP